MLRHEHRPRSALIRSLIRRDRYKRLVPSEQIDRRQTRPLAHVFWMSMSVRPQRVAKEHRTPVEAQLLDGRCERRGLAGAGWAPDTGDDVSEGSPQPTSAVVPSTTSIVVILVQRREECFCRLWSSTVRLAIIVLPMSRTPQQTRGSTSDFDSSVLPEPTCGAEPGGLSCGDRRNTTTIGTTNPMSITPSSSGNRGGSVTGDDALRISAGESSSSRGGGAGGRRRARSRCCPSLRTRPPTEIRR